jgi:hypothetical protein
MSNNILCTFSALEYYLSSTRFGHRARFRVALPRRSRFQFLNFTVLSNTDTPEKNQKDTIITVSFSSGAPNLQSLSA